MNHIKIKFSILIEKSKLLGLPEIDIYNASEFLKYSEYELCFDTIITQMYEYDVKIDEDYYRLVQEIGIVLKVPVRNFSFMEQLIR